MRKIIFAILAIIVLLLGVILVVPSLIPSDVYKDKIETQLSKELGRDVTIAGDVKLQSLPLIRAKTSGVAIKNYEGFTETNLLSVETLEARIRLLPLLSQRVEISGFDLIKPVVSLERRADGFANWDTKTEASKTADDENAPFKRDGRISAIDPQIEAFKLVGGKLSYRDAVSGQSYSVDNLDGFLSMPGLSQPLKLELALDYEGERVDVDFDINSVRAFLDGEETPVVGTIESEYGSINIEGEFLETEALDFRGQFDVKISDATTLANFSPQDIPNIELLKNLTAKGEVSFINSNISSKNVDADVEGEGFAMTYKGDGSLSDEGIEASGSFNSSIEDIAKLADKLELENDYIALLRNLSADGNIKVQGETIILSETTATATNGSVNGTYQGGLSLSETPAANGRFNIAIADLEKVADSLPDPIPYAKAVKSFDLSGQVRTEGQTFIISETTSTLSNGLLNGSYSGGAQYNLDSETPLSFAGNLDAIVTDVRALAALGGTKFPPSTANGSIFQTLVFDGTLSGTSENLTIQKAKVEFDDIKGEGEIMVSFNTSKPFITSDLILMGLDLRPYMASYSAQNPTGEIQPWSEAPINTEAFNAIDGAFNLSTPNIITDRLSLGQTNIAATLKDGVFDADLPNLSLYSGGGRIDVTFDISKSVPELTLTAGLDKLNGNNFLTAIAGFTQASGQAKTDVSIKGSGKSQADIMRSLNGQGGFNLVSGSIKGIDAAQFMSGLNQALSARQLPTGIGAEYETIYRDISALFKIENGVVTINEFDFKADQVAATGLGEIDLGNQTVDFRFRPKAIGANANQLTSFGIPLKFSGGFGSASAGLDTDFLSEIITAKAKAEATKRITDNVGGPLGGIIGGVINGSSSNTETSDTQKSPEDAVTNALGGLLGLPSTQKEDEKEPDEKKKDEKSELEKSLGKLFGE